MSPNPHYIGSDRVPAEAEQNAGTRPLIRPEPIVRVQELAYVLFQRPELQQQRAFLEDFGLRLAADEGTTLYFRGHGPSPWFYAVEQGEKPRFLGAGYAVASRTELEKIAGELNRQIEPVTGPGGGERVRLSDPDGFIVDVVYGRESHERIPTRDSIFVANTPGTKSRVNEGVRSTAEPCPLEKLGHFVLGATNFQRSAKWYMENLGFIPSDVQTVKDGTPVLAFLRCDRGKVPTDHHTLAIAQNLAPGLMHSAYETLDIDSIGQGAEYLKWKGWQHHWGIGRHILGSQLFDYWLDPCGVEMEHYADGDVYTADHPTGYHPLSPGSLYTWGDDLPPAPTPGKLQILKLVLSGKARKLPPVLGKMRAALSASGRPWIK